MNTNAFDKSIDDLLEDPSFLNAEKTAKVEYTTVTFWVPVDIKMKYQELQKSSERQFAKALKQIICKAINKSHDAAGSA